MRSTSGAYYDKLDHVRALAAFLVFTWHFSHAAGVAPDHVPLIPVLSFFEEGHTGVAIFMVLSGYLFAKLIDGRPIHYGAFLWNRFIRLAPLLLVTLAVAYALEVMADIRDIHGAIADFLFGLVFPRWPNGGWSLVAEVHFYLLLPLILFTISRGPWFTLAVIGGVTVLRLDLYLVGAPVQDAAYWTIIGRLDQFLLGFAAWGLVRNRAVPFSLMLAAAIGLTVAAHWFNLAGGFAETRFSPIWIVATTVEGLGYAILIAWYDRSPFHLPPALSAALARIGQVSYSIYLLHFFVVFEAAWLLGRLLPGLGYTPTLLISAAAFLAFVPFAWISHRLIESPLLRFRRDYRRAPAVSGFAGQPAA